MKIEYQLVMVTDYDDLGRRAKRYHVVGVPYDVLRVCRVFDNREDAEAELARLRSQT